MDLILDTDPGVDDAMAFYYAHANPDIRLRAMTTVFGNVTVEDATRNAAWMRAHVGAQSEVHRGSAMPLVIPPNPPSANVHGPAGLGDVEIGEFDAVPDSEDAAGFLVRAAAAAPGTLTLCAIGPLTNVAEAVRRDPAFVENLHQLVIMGGALDAPGNVTPHAEANFWNDPDAADIVLNAPGGGEILVIGLDVTTLIAYHAADFDALAEAAPKVGSFLRSIGQFYMRFYETVTGNFQCYLHDPAALIACERDDLFKMEPTPLSVMTEGQEIGRLRRDPSRSRVCFVAMAVDAPAVLARYNEIVARND